MGLKKKSIRMSKGNIFLQSVAHKKAYILLFVMTLAVPVTLTLVAEEQDTRQEASVRTEATYVTTVPKDTTNINISNKDGTQKSSGGGSKKTTSSNPDSNDDGDSNSGDCTTEDTTEQSSGGTKRTININCNGNQNQVSDKSGSDGQGSTKQSPKESKSVGQTTDKKSTKKEKKRDGSDSKARQIIDRIWERLRNK